MVDTQTATPYHSKALPQGSILREWKLEQVLGVGGFGIVYRGRGVYFDEIVAIKEYFPSAISDRTDGTTVTPTDSSSEEVYSLGLKKFVDEARILWGLSKPDRHPNIVSVKALFEIHGTAYMVMDFEDGVSLSHHLREGKRFDEASLLAIIRPIAEGLERAHRAGVIHRDIKPANILLDSNGRPVLIDFGSARFESGQATSTKVTFYTPPYAALEQYVKTYPQGPWTDIYALAVTAYQCVTGDKPADALERMAGGAGEALSARERPGYSTAFCRAVDAGMALRPSERPQSLSEWLKLFDAPPQTIEDDATRISIAPAKAAPAAAAAVEEAAPAPAEKKRRPKSGATPDSAAPARDQAATPSAPEPVAARAEAVEALAPTSGKNAPAALETPAEADESQRRGLPLPLLAAAGAAVLVLGGGAAAAYLFLGHAKPGPAAASSAAVAAKAAPGQPQVASAAPSAAPAAPTVVPSVEPVVQAAAGLLADAQHAGRPRSELGVLYAQNAKITTLASQIGAGPASGAPPLVQQLNGAAVSMARSEVAALNRSAQAQAREVSATLSGSSAGADAVASVEQAKQSLAAAGAGAGQASDPVAAISAARRALPAYAAFAAAYARATPFYAVARRSAVTAVISDAQRYEAQIVSYASGPRPGLFASQGRRQAYQQLQDDAEKAKALEAQLDRIAQTANAATDVASVNAALAEATSVKASLGSLYASAAAVVQANK
ncbi:MAG TPA: protein kinase [Caulobacteraceae bacterium]|nr:protein kinase [Caulobacteraceae bacterium]